MSDQSQEGIVPVDIELTEEEILRAAHGGVGRRMVAMKRGYRSVNGSGLGLWEQDIQGAAAELAACKWMHIPWDPTVGRINAVDAGPNVQVRWTREDHKPLILRPGDKPDHVFILVVGRIPIMRLVGWCWGRDGMTDDRWEYFRTQDRYAWVVPQDKLRPMRKREEAHAA